MDMLKRDEVVDRLVDRFRTMMKVKGWDNNILAVMLNASNDLSDPLDFKRHIEHLGITKFMTFCEKNKIDIKLFSDEIDQDNIEKYFE